MRHDLPSVVSRLVLVLGVCCLLVSSAAAATRQLGRFQSWSAHLLTEGKVKTCYAHSVPKQAKGNYKRRGAVYVQITHRRAERRMHEVGFTAGYTYKNASEVEIDIDGNRFKLFTDRDTAWAYDSKADLALVRAMMKGRVMVVRGTSSRGTRTTDSYSLSGFTRAHRAIGKACGVK